MIPATWGWQELLLFQAPLTDPSLLDVIANRIGARVLRLVASDGTAIYGWHRPARGERAVLFFHGNAETLADRIALHDFLVELGWDVVMVAYRGYPGSPGAPSEEGLRLDARTAWKFARDTLGLAPDRIVIHGKSLGGGVAAMLAEEAEAAGLVLESTFLSIADVAKVRFPVSAVDSLLKHRFDTRSRAPAIRCPVLVLHADMDPTVPVQNGRGLGALFADVRYVEVHGLGHGETLPMADPDARRAYVELLEQVAANANATAPRTPPR